jgi:hypothetical protein
MMQVLECLQEKQERREREYFWQDCVAKIVGAKKTITEIWNEAKELTHVTTADEIAKAEDVGRKTAAAFGML